MKATVELKEFKNAVDRVSLGVPVRSAIPILTGILIETENKTTIKMTSNDIEMGIVARCPAVIEEEGSIVLPGKLFIGIIRGMNGGAVMMTTQPERCITEVTCGKSFFKLSGYPAESFPVFPPFDETRYFTVKSEQLRAGFNQTIFAVSDDETRASLTGVLIEKKEDVIYLAATNGHRLSLHRMEYFNNQFEDRIRYIIPARVALAIMRSLSGEMVKVIPGPGEILFDLNRVMIYSRLIEGAFPEYETVLPLDYMATITVPRKKFLEVLERVSLVTTPEEETIYFHFEGNQLQMTCESQGLGIAKEEIEVDIEGQILDLAFNIRFLVECVRVAPWEKIIIGINGEVAPTLMFGDTDEFRYIIMPIKVREEE